MTIESKPTMVCVTVQRTCERLIREGSALAGEEALRVVHVVRSGGAVLGAGDEGEALEYLYRVSSQYGAQMDMLRADDVVATITEFARKHGIAYLVIGAPAGHSRIDIAATLRARLPDVRVFVIP